jgi:EmrB/QacA subfamily drug resistance transporter
MPAHGRQTIQEITMSTAAQDQDDGDVLRLAPADPVAAARPRWGALLVILAGAFVTTLDFFIVNVAVPSIEHGLHANSAQVQFFVAGYGLAAASGMIIGGRLGDIFGRRRMFAIGLALFTVASLGCGIAQNPGELITGRVIQGIATAMLSPQVLAIVSTTYEGAQRARAFMLYGLTVGFASVFGQLIGGCLIAADVAGLGWRLIFLINLPVGVLALAFAGRVVPESKSGGSRLDLPGALLVSASLAATVVPLIEGRQQGWPWWTAASFAAAAVLLTVFVFYQHALGRRGGSPLVNLALFKERAFTVGLVGMLAWASAMASFFLILSLYLQNGRSLSALDSGLIFLTMSTGFFVASTLAPKLGIKMGRQLLAVGSLVVAAGYLALAVTATSLGQSGAVEWLIPGLFVSGWGMGMVFAPLPATILAGIAPQSAAAASGVLTTVQEVGGALGVALVGIVFFSSLGRSGSITGYPHAFSYGLILLAAFTVLVALLVQALPKAANQA